MAFSVPPLVQRVVLDNRELLKGAQQSRRALEETGDEAEKLGPRLTAGAAKVGKSMTTFVTAPILGAGAASVKMASDMSESLSKVKVVFGQSAKDIEAWSKSAATSLGMSRQQALEAAGTFGNLFRAMGIATPAAADMSKKMIGLAADLASFNNANPEDVLLALRAGLVGETEPLRRFGVNLNQARIEAEAFAMGLVQPIKNAPLITKAHLAVESAQRKLAEAQKEHGKESLQAREAANALALAQDNLSKVTEGSVPDLTAAAKAQAAYSLIMKDTTLAQGDYSRTAGGTANQMRTMTAQLKDAGAALGVALLPAVTSIVKSFNNFITAFKGLSPETQKFVVIALAVVAALGPMLLISAKLVTAMGVLGGAVGKTVGLFRAGATGVSPFGKALSVVATGIKAVALSLARGLLILAANPFTLVIGAVIALGAALVLLYRRSETFRNIVQAVMGAVVGFFKTGFEVIKQIFETYWNAVRVIVAVNVAILIGIVKMLAAVLTAIFQGIAAVARPIFEALGAFIGFVWKTIQAVTLITWNAIRTILTTVWTALVAVGRPIFEGIRTVVTTVWNAIAGVTTAVWNGIRGTLTGIWNGLKTSFQTVWDGIQGIARGAMDGLSRTLSSLRNIFASPINWVIDNVINKFLGAVESVANALPGASISLPRVPRVPTYHQGGVVGGGPPGKRRGEELALLERGEGVLPARTMRDLGPATFERLRRGRTPTDALTREEWYGVGRPVGDGFGWVTGALKAVGSAVGAVVAKVREAIANVARPMVEGAMGLLGRVPGPAGPFIGGVARKLGDHILSWISGVEKEVAAFAPPLSGGIGWQAMWDALRTAFPSAQLFSALRPGAVTRATGRQSYHALGRAIDVTPSTAIGEWIRANYMAQTREMIYSPMGARQVHNGGDHFYTGVTRDDHWDHVHWAMGRGGVVTKATTALLGERGGAEAVIPLDRGLAKYAPGLANPPAPVIHKTFNLNLNVSRAADAREIADEVAWAVRGVA